MRAIFNAIIGIIAILGLFLLAQWLCPRLLDSKIGRIHERGLPKVSLESGGIVYFRMKADDFCFSLPRGSQPVLPITFTGGFDWVDGNVQVTFGNSNHSTLPAYEQSLARLLPTGGSISVAPVPGGWNIKFHYFGDK